MPSPLPRTTAPALAFETLRHGRFDLATTTPRRGTVISVYRGLHCPICAKHLAELERTTAAFEEKGYETVAVSVDDAERAGGMAEKIPAKDLRIGYGLDIETARAWGLYISSTKGVTSIGLEEPRLFAEPGLFIVNADRTVYYASVQSMPFARPNFDELLGALDFVIANDYPARGEVAA